MERPQNGVEYVLDSLWGTGSVVEVVVEMVHHPMDGTPGSKAGLDAPVHTVRHSDYGVVGTDHNRENVCNGVTVVLGVAGLVFVEGYRVAIGHWVGAIPVRDASDSGFWGEWGEGGRGESGEE